MQITINGQLAEAESGITILEAAEKAGIRIPTLCYLKEINEISACRICAVQVNGAEKLVPACSTKISEGMSIETDNDIVRASRKQTLELICSDHRMECTECARGADCELRNLIKEYGADDRSFGTGSREQLLDESSPAFIRDNSKCVLCRRCVSTCANMQGIGAISVNYKGEKTNVGFPAGLKQSDTLCISCGQCVAACPTGALSEKDDTKKVWKALYDKKKMVIIAVSPETAYSIGRLFGEKERKDNAGKLSSILHKIGFEQVIDGGCYNNAYQDKLLELVESAKECHGTPALSGECYAFLNYVRLHRPELAEYLPKLSPLDEYTAERVKALYPDSEVFYVSISNCMAAKSAGHKYVDACLTTRELFSLIRRACVSNFTAEKVWEETEPEDTDNVPEGMNSAQPLELPAVMHQTINSCGKAFKKVTVTGLKEAIMLLEKGKEADLIEIRACRGGCLNGGGA